MTKLLSFDEVFTGWGKTGELFYFMHFDVLPDIIITSKSLGGGKASIAGYIAREKVFQQAYGKLADTTLHSTTYNGFGEECYTAIEAINVLIEEDLVANAQAIGQQLTSGLTQLQAKFPTTIKHCGGIGALQGIQLTTGPEILQKLMPLIPGSFFNDSRFVQKLITASVINELYHQHKVLTYYGENNDITLMAAPSLIATEQQVTYYLDALEQCLSQGLLTLVMKFVRSKLFAKFLLMQGG